MTSESFPGTLSSRISDRSTVESTASDRTESFSGAQSTYEG